MMKSQSLLSAVAVASLFGLQGCAAQAEQPFVQANKLPEAPQPVAAVVTPTMLAGNHQHAIPREPEAQEPAETPWQVIEHANSASAQNPDRHGYFNAIMTYDYTPGYLYQVYTAPLKITDIQLQPGEVIEGQPACGDTVRWVLGVGKSQTKGVVQQHLYIKPTKPGLHTTLIVTTNRRTYHIELHSYRETFMAAVNWNYPHEDMQQLVAQNQMTTASHVDINTLNFGYEVKVKNGSRPVWMPVKVFDDSRKTFIQFPAEMLTREAPALFVLSRNGSTQLVNYRVKNQFYVIDRLFDRAELRIGQKDQSIVRIVRR